MFSGVWPEILTKALRALASDGKVAHKLGARAPPVKAPVVKGDRMSDVEKWPVELRLSSGGATLTVTWADGERHEIAAELLRVESPSAEVQGHSPEQKTIVPGKRNVKIRDVQEVGSYAVRLLFDDGHDTGIYTWDALRRFGEDGAEMFDDYEAALSSLGLKR